MALELEYNYFSGTDFDKDKVVATPGGPGTFNGTINVHTLFLNFKARYPNGKFHPYAGFGLGYSYFMVGDITSTVGVGSAVAGKAGDAFCYQLFTGLDYDITPKISLGIGYKYFSSKPTIGKAGDDLHLDFDYKANIVTLGVTYNF
jgi:opacity protein-like surface antigen